MLNCESLFHPLLAENARDKKLISTFVLSIFLFSFSRGQLIIRFISKAFSLTAGPNITYTQEYYIAHVNLSFLPLKKERKQLGIFIGESC